ncbi:MAG TPA: hypothetical protein PK079_09630 [Leptospiraceae bacterium]|nr:hypothetical protein [Leptospiraceae bacterium]HMW04566.1 hypothetical protein [Leptospiraceae bacterium]HMX33439.1 hypothetical protein [Leptospiraceae bacterium]HMY30752.1 hypothetical protein [Leptospiraceae bacterium]HMZ64330.1 hypothetical protein [Leptospiraceae bacterium]
MKNFLQRVYIVFLLSVPFSPLFSSESFESSASVEDANLKVVKLLNKITDNSIRSMESTGGFNYRYKSGLISPFRFNVYVGKISKKSEDSIIRIESTKNGEAKLLKTILEVELNKSAADYKFEQVINPKYHIVSQSLNLITPAASVLYNSYNSPFYTNSDTILKAGTYVLIDLFIVALAAVYINNSKVGNKNIYDDLLNKKGPGKDFRDYPQREFILAALLIPRIYRSIEAFHDTAAQNRIAELSYTYRF